MEDLPSTLAERVDELIISHKQQEFVSTMGTQAALQELTARSRRPGARGARDRARTPGARRRLNRSQQGLA